jgi:hypothetical protein
VKTWQARILIGGVVRSIIPPRWLSFVCYGPRTANPTLAAFAPPHRQDRRPDHGTAVNAAGTKKIAADVIAECQKNSWHVAVAVVENHGFLVYFERMDSTLMAAWAKAAATYQRPTRVFADLINKGDRSRPPFALAWRPADFGRRQGHRRRARQRGHRRSGRAMRQGQPRHQLTSAEAGARPASAHRVIGLSLSPSRD